MPKWQTILPHFLVAITGRKHMLSDIGGKILFILGGISGMPRKAQTKKTKAKEPFSKSVTLV
jgi:hypothetical protein